MKIEETWAETLAAVFLLSGFFISLLIHQATLNYLITFFSGGLAGRLFYVRRYKEPIFPFILIILGFLFGYLLGTFWGSRLIVVILFLSGFGISYYLHLKKKVVIFKSKEFIK